MDWLSNLFNFLALSLLRLFAFLPYSITIYVGYGLGWLAAHIPNSRSKVVKTNLRLCFPNLTDKEIDTLALKHWKLFGRSVIERSRVWLGTSDQILSFVRLESEVPLGDRKPRILVNPHFVGLEGGFMALSALGMKNGWPRGAGLYQKMKNLFLIRKWLSGAIALGPNRLKDKVSYATSFEKLVTVTLLLLPPILI